MVKREVRINKKCIGHWEHFNVFSNRWQCGRGDIKRDNILGVKSRKFKGVKNG
jgi:hypothetical protein